MNSSSRESPKQKRNLNESNNITTILPPEITSTPFISNKSKVPSPLVTPTRKFLGPRRYALSNNGMLNPVKTIKDPPGPLLASTAYNVNVSTYIDTKSPGYAGRLVQYNEESSRKQQNTHQEKYGSPGLFPIVHLFKKEVPVISPKLKKGTVRIGTPESRGCYSQEHNRLLLEGIVRNNSILKEQNTSNEASTRSVLDALKEISRKRIHVNEDYEPIDDNNKKFRRANGDGDYSKRNRVESPTSDNASSPPTTQAKKRLCTIDAVLASKTSSMYANYEMSSKRKSVEDSNNGILPMNKKKFNNVETQTPGTPVIVREMKRTTITKQSEEKKVEKPIEKNEEIGERISSPKQVLKVLDDKPLEVIRKNRLGALLSALSGREIPSIPMEDRRKALDKDWPSSHNSEKTLVSILSPQNKQTKSLEKHVTFDLPSNTGSVQFVSERNSTATEKQEKKNESNAGNKNSSSELSSANNTIEKRATDIIQPDKKASIPSFTKLETSDTKKEEKEKTVGGFKFDLTKPHDSKSIIADTPPAENKTKPENKITVNFSSPSSTSSSFKPMLGSQSFISEGGGLSTKSTIETSFSKGSSSINSLGLPTSLPITSSNAASSTITSASFMFGSKPSGDAATVPTNTSGKENVLFAFGKKEPSQSGPENSSISSISNSAAAQTSGKIESSSINSSPFGSKTVTSSTFAFNGTSNLSTASSDNRSASFSLTTSTPSFCTTTSSVSTISSASASTSVFPSKTFDTVANSPSSKSNFGTSNSSPGGFKFNSGNSLPAFGSPSLNSVPASTSTIASNAFGSPMNPVATSANAPFETSSKSSNPFLSAPTNTASTSIFGANAPANNALKQDPKPFAFGSSNVQNSVNSGTSNNTSSTNQSGVTTNSSTSAPLNLAFGSTVSNTSNMFASGKNPATASFGASTAASSFGTTNSFSFGAPSTTSLTTPSSSTSLFSTNNTAPSFGSTSTPSFGTTSNPSFGTTSTSSFGTTSAPSFGTTNTSSFGTTNTPSFGTTNTPGFGTTNTPSFGTTSTPSFGTANTSSFGTTSAPSFGTKNTPSFGTTNTPTFGTTSAPSFGATNTPSFGSTYTPNFGSTNTPNYGTNSTGAFGTTNTPSFSTSNTNFNSTSTPTYGTISSPSFGTTNTSNFSTNKAPLFGNNSSAFGTTSTGGTSGANNAFGAKNTTSSVFGSNTPTFGTPSSTTFGTTNASTFGNATTTSTFGGSFSSPSTLSAPSFGNPTSPFGNAATSNANAFNSNNPSSNFGSANSFGTFNSNNSQFTSVTTASGFGTSTNNTFGNSPATNAFGANATSSTFGSTDPSSPFNTNVNPTPSNAFASSFGKKPEQSSSVFPSSTNNMFNSNSAFGSAQSNNNGGSGGSTSSGIFTFGSSNSNAPSSAGVFTFGSPEPPKSFNFNAAGNAGAAPAPSAGGFNSVPSFGQPSAAVPNMFSIGSGNSSSTSQARGRPLVRARRRT
ncbi:nuclear pore complex protein DDB_G0274915-like [Coccinella septempunctata]|uniref:nuclear pore complex protein DDB_G0274915-like n=1 Tax=Coccinella septempunctata TaxID=41139 RepID=UPI001D0854FE|nr:nuclear pore complex protein DDB_G0274915-like [Coccinella septempunctata]